MNTSFTGIPYGDPYLLQFRTYFYYSISAQTGLSIFITPTLTNPAQFNRALQVWSASAGTTYPDNGTVCTYQARTFLAYTDEGTGSVFQNQTYEVYDDLANAALGSIGLAPVPNIKVCEGQDVTVNFTNSSVINCVAPIETSIKNSQQRWYQYVYGENAANPDFMDKVEVIIPPGTNNWPPGANTFGAGGGLQITFPYNGPITMLAGPNTELTALPPSFQIHVLNTNVFGPDNTFTVRLRMWNICNPYDNQVGVPFGDGGLIPTGSPAADANGDSAPITVTDDIILVQRPLPPTVLPSPATFCVNMADPSYNLTAAGVGGATFKWYKDAALTILLKTAAGFNPVLDDAPVVNKTIANNITYYVTQTVTTSATCESLPRTVTFIIQNVVVPGVIAHPLGATPISVCLNTDPAAFTSTTDASGGAGGPYTYQWQTSPDGTFAPPTNVGVNSNVFDPPAVAAGIYYRRQASSGVCPTTNSNVIQFTTRPIPTLSSSLTPPAICSGTVFNYTATSVTPGTTFAWSRALVAGITEAASAGAGNVSETLTNTTTAAIPVTYVYISTAAGCSNAPGQNVVVNVNPTPSLSSSLTPPAICSATLFSYVPTSVTGGATFPWTRATIVGITPAGPTSGTGNPSETLTNSTTAPINVTYVFRALAAGCQHPGQNVVVTVNPIPALSSSLTPPAICSGSLFTYTPTSATAGATFPWTRAFQANITPAGPTSGMGDPNETLTNSSTAPITVTYVFRPLANACQHAGQNVQVIVNPIPAFTSSLTPPAICSGSNFSYTPTSSTAGATFPWTRASIAGITPVGPTGGTGNPNEALTNTTTAPISVTYVFTVTANGCPNPAGNNVVVVVNPIPVLTSTLTPPAICSGTLFSYVPTSATAGSTFPWTRATIAGITPVGPTSGTGNPSETLGNTTTAPINVTYIFRPLANACQHAGQSVVVTVNPIPVLSSSLAPPAFCSGATFSYVPTSATAGATFPWSRATIAGIAPAGPTAGAGNPMEALTNSTLAPISVTYVYTTTANGCVNPGQNVVVTVNPIPNFTSTLTPIAICSGTNFSYTPTSGVAGATFAWSRAAVVGITQGASAGAGNPNELLNNTTAAAIPVTYAYSVTANGCTNAGPFNVVVNVNPVAVLSSSLTPPGICSGSTFNYTGNSATGGATFSWTRATIAGITEPGVGPIASNLISETLTNTTTAPINVTYAFILTSGGCSNPQNVVVAVNPIPVLTSTLAPTGICTANVFSYTPTSATAGATFAWTRAVVGGISEGASAGAGNVAEVLTNVTAAPINVTYIYITSANGCNNSPGQSVVVSVNPLPLLSSTLTPAAICSGTTFSYVPTSATGGTTFNWNRAVVANILPLGPTSGANNPNEILTNTSAAIVNVTYAYTVSANGCNNVQNVVVPVNPTPTLSSSLTGAICSGVIFNYTGTSATGGTAFSWTRAAVGGITEPGVGPIASNMISESLTNTTTFPINVTYAFTLTANGCSNPQNVVLTVNPVPVFTSTLTPPAICSGTIFSYVPASSTPGASFAWTRAVVVGIAEAASSGSGLPGAGGNPNEILTNITTAPINVTYVYTVSANGCNNPVPNSVVVVVNPIPVLSSTLTPPAICSGSVFNYVPTSATGGAVFPWNRATIAGILPAGPTLGFGDPAEALTNTTTAPINVTYVYTTSANGCTNPGQNVVVTVNPIPVLSSTLTPPAICSGSTFSYTATSATAGATFAWSRPLTVGISEAASAGAGNVSETLTNTTPLPIVVTYTYITSANGCNNAPGQSVPVTVNPIPAFTSTLTPPAICSGVAFIYTATSSTPGATFNWGRAVVVGISQAASAGAGNVNEVLTNITAAPIAVTYIYTVTANGCPNPGPFNVVVNVNPTPSLSSGLSPPAICSSGVAVNFNYTATSATVGATFQWTRAGVAGISQVGVGPIASGVVAEMLTNTTTAPVNVTYAFVSSFAGCNNPQNVVVTVNPTPILSSSLTPPAICSSTAFIYTPTSATVGAAFTWSRAAVVGITEAATAGASNVNETLTNTTTAPINVTYFYTTTANGCPNAGQNVVVVVNPIPVLSSTLSPPDICSATVFNYAPTSATAGATFAWTRAVVAGISQGASLGSTGGGNADPNELLTNTTTAPISVTYVYITTANGCSNLGQNVAVNVNPLPVLNSTLTPPAVCSLSNFNYVPTSATIGATFAWTRAAVAGISEPAGAGAGTINEVLTNTTTLFKTVTYIYTTTAAGCSGAPQNVVVQVNPTPEIFDRIISVCSGSAFTISPSNGVPTAATIVPGGTTYAWGAPVVTGGITGGSAQAGQASISQVLTNPTNVPQTATYVVIPTSGASGLCAGPSFQVFVTVNPKPVIPNQTPAAICSGTAFTVSPVDGVPTAATIVPGGTTYTWAPPVVTGGITGSSGQAGQPSISQTLTNPSTSLATATYTVTPTSGAAGSCVGANFQIVVTVNPTPILSSTLAPAGMCNGTFNYVPTSATVGSTFTWSRAAVAGILEGATAGAGNVSEPLTNVTTSPINVTYVYITTANGCNNAPGESVVVTVNPTPGANPVTGFTLVCENNTANVFYSVTANGANTYSWTVPAGFTIVAGGGGATAGGGLGPFTSVFFLVLRFPVGTLPGTPSGVLSVTEKSTSGCNGLPNNLTVNIIANPGPVAFQSNPGPSTIFCKGQNLVKFEVTSPNAGSSYTWALPLGGATFNGPSGGPSVFIDFSSVQNFARITVFETNSAGCAGTLGTLDVTLSDPPVMVAPFAAAICSGEAPFTAATPFTLAADQPSTFSWTVSSVSPGIIGVFVGQPPTAGQLTTPLNNTTTSPGTVTFSVTPTATAAPNCAGPAQSYTITVNPTPVLSSTLTPAAICSGAAFTYTATSATGGATFAWSRALVPGIAEAASAGVANVNETLTNSTTAPINVTYVYVTTANSCSSPPQNVVVAVNPIPVLSSTLAPPAICSGSTFSYTATSATAGATFAWSRAAVGGISQGASAGAGNVNETLTNITTAPINVTYVYVTSANGCVSPPQNVVVAVNPIPVLSSTLTPPAICSASVFNYTATSATGGATFAWSRSAIGGITEAATAGAGNVSETLTNTTTAPISVTYVYVTTANGCPSAPQNVAVVVNPIPTLSSTLTPPAICSGATFNYTATSATAGSAFAWSRAAVVGITEAASAGAGNVSEVLTNTTTAPINVTYVYITTANGCPSVPQNVVVTVNPIPVLSSTLAPPGICSATTFSYTATSATAGATFAWSRAAVAGISQGASAGIGGVSETLTNTTTASINVAYVYITSANGCFSGPQNVVVAVNPTPVLSSTLTPPAICSGATFIYTATSATAGTAFSWSRAAVVGITEAATAGAGNVSETLTNTTTASIVVTYVYITSANGCISAPQNVVVTVNPIPALSSTLTPPAICSGSTFAYTATSATAGATFAWSRAVVAGISQGASAGVGNVSETLTNITTSPINVTYVYVTTANGCPSAPQNVVVAVNPLPTLSSTLAPPGICSGATFTYTATSATALATFAWSRAAVPGITEAATAGAGNVSETLTNTTTASINVTYVYVTTANGCPSIPQNVVVAVNPIPTLTSTLAPPAICSAATFNYTATTATAGATFAWSRAAVAGITEGATAGPGNVSETLTNTTTAPINVTYVYITTANGCPSAPQNVVVTVNPFPSLSSSLTPPAICSGSTFAYMATSATAGATFSWSRSVVGGISQGASAGIANVSETLTNTTTAPINVTYAYVTTANGCVSAPQNVVVVVNPIPVLSSTLTPAAICSGATFTYNALSGTAGATFAWSRAAIAGITEAATAGIANVSETLTNTTTAPINVIYAYVTTANGCVSPTQNVVVTVNPVPVLSSTLTPPSICSGSTFSYTATSATAGASFAWSRALVAGITQAASAGAGNVSEILTNTTTAPINVTYIYITTANGCPSAPQNVVVTVNPIPTLSSTLTPLPICSGTIFSYNATSATVGATFAWSRSFIVGISEGPVSSTGNVNETLTNTTSAPIVVTYVYVTTANSCSNAPQNVTVTVNPIPALSSTLTPPSICSGAPFNYTATSPTGGATFAWSRAAVAGISEAASAGAGNVSEILTNTTTAPISVTYVYVVSANSCSSLPQNVVVVVNPIPVLTSTLAPAGICSGATFTYTATSATAGATFAWSRAGVAGISQAASSGTGNISETLTNTTSGAINVTYVYVTTANGCASPPQNIVVSVGPLVVVNPVPNVVVCSGLAVGPINFTSSLDPAVTYNWTNDNTAIGILGSGAGAISFVAAINTGSVPFIANLSVTGTTGGSCVGAPTNFTITVNPEPVLANPGFPDICSTNANTSNPVNIVLGTNGTSVNVGPGGYQFVQLLYDAGSGFNDFTTPVANFTRNSGPAPGGSGGINHVKNDTYTSTRPTPVTVRYVIRGTSSAGCSSALLNYDVVINPQPTLAATAPPPLCSGVALGITINKAATPTSPAINQFEYKNVLFPGLGASIVNASYGLYTPGNFLAGDIYTNTTNGPLNVTYTIAPISIDGCKGPDQTIVFTVNPAPGMPNLNATVCTGIISGIVLADNSPTSVAAVSYDYNTNMPIPAGLTPGGGNAGVGNTADVNVIRNDVFTNTTNTIQTVTYQIKPVALSGCKGPTTLIVLTVEPPIVAAPVNNKPGVSLCSFSSSSNDPTDIDLLSPTIPSAGGITFNYTASALPAGSITGFFPALSNLAAGYKITDNLINNTNSPATVTYNITAVANGARGGAGCSGTAVPVTVTVEPRPRLVPSTSLVTVCEQVSPNIALNSPTLPSVGGIDFLLFSVTPSNNSGIVSNFSPAGTVFANGSSLVDLLNSTSTSAEFVTYIFRPRMTGGALCIGNDVTVTVNVNPRPNLTTVPPVTTAICSCDIFNVLFTSDVANTVSTWPAPSTSPTAGSVTGAGPGAGDQIFQILFNNTSPLLQTVTYTVTPQASGCTGTPLVIPVQVYPVPDVLGTSNQTVCHGTTLNVPLSSKVTAGVTFAWTVSDPSGIGAPGAFDGSGTTINQPMSNTTGAQATLTYTIVPTLNAPGTSGGSCTGPSKIMVVTVAPQISAAFLNTPSPDFICLGSSEYLVFQFGGQAPFDFTYTITTASPPSTTTVNVVNKGPVVVIQETPTIATAYTYRITSVTSRINGVFCTQPVNVPFIVNVGDTDPTFSIIGPAAKCSPNQVSFQYNQVAGTIYTWRFGESADSIYQATTNVPAKVIKHTYTNLSPNSTLNYPASMQTELPPPYPGCFKTTPPKTVTIYPNPIVNVIPNKTDICSGESITFMNSSVGTNSQQWSYRVKGPPPGPEIVMGTSFNINYTFTNTTTNNPIIYEVIFRSNNTANCPPPDVTMDIQVFRSSVASFNEGTVPTFLNGESLVTFTNTSSIIDPGSFTYDWVFGVDSQPPSFSGTAPGTIRYVSPGPKDITLNVTNTARAACKTMFTKSINIILAPLVATFTATPPEACFPSKIVITQTNITGDVIEWKVFDQNGRIVATSSAVQPTFNIPSDGEYTITLKTSSSQTGQFANAPNQIVKIYPKPFASFDARPSIVFVPDTELITFNFSTGANKYGWDFGDGITSTDEEPKHIYKIEGIYTISLFAKFDHGNGLVCADTLKKQIQARQGGVTKVPNAFTPSLNGPSGGQAGNGSFNDVFLPIVKGADEFNLQIYDRWGNLVFESNSSRIGWDGYNLDGILLPAGVYVYKLTIRLSDGQRSTQIGDVTMIR
ncbi:MAG: PKD-like domain-containing protein [Cytophagales bacterium]|nr:PKD-like domain-containing protein [Cytophagales bacterium]